MTDYNKLNLKNWSFGAIAALVGFFTFVACWYVCKAGGAWCIPFPILGTGYGIYAFLKKYLKPLPRPENK